MSHSDPYQTLHIERRGPCAWIWMNRGEIHNAFDESLIAELTQAIEQLQADAATRVIVLAGRGRSFSAGADLNWMRRQGQASREDNEADARRLGRLFRSLAECVKPTIARVHGTAMAGGMGLAAACDICIASTQAVFSTSEVKLGIIPAVISPYLVRAIGLRQCYRYFQTAEKISAEHALALGLVHELVAPELLDGRVDAVVESLLAAGPGALAACKSLLAAVAGRPLDDALVDDTARRIAAQRATAEAQEGLSAFFARRPPDWTLAK